MNKIESAKILHAKAKARYSKFPTLVNFNDMCEACHYLTHLLMYKIDYKTV